jgi:NAD(P)H-hydrate epimerase
VKALQCGQVRAADEEAIRRLAIPSVTLMENAGRGAAELLVSLGIHGKVVICCGKGNNGGDGLVIARHLHLLGVQTLTLLCAGPDELKGDALTNYRIVERMALPMKPAVDADGTAFDLRFDLATAHWIVDALVGTGLAGPLRNPLAGIIEQINSSGSRVLAVDIPSGLNGDTGQPMGPTVRADHTATFLALKAGFLAPGAAAWTGKVHLLGIGAPCLVSQ